jgi:hypothetical protein
MRYLVRLVARKHVYTYESHLFEIVYAWQEDL